MGFFTGLALILIVLKLLGYIAISWWLVLLPILPMLFILCVIYGTILLTIVATFSIFLVGLVESIFRKRK